MSLTDERRWVVQGWGEQGVLRGLWPGRSSEKDPNVSWDRWMTARADIDKSHGCACLCAPVCVCVCARDLLCYKLGAWQSGEAGSRLSRVI